MVIPLHNALALQGGEVKPRMTSNLAKADAIVRPDASDWRRIGMRAMGRKFGLVAAAIWLGLAAPAAAQEGEPDVQSETRIGKEGFKSPPATLAQMDWLVGQWVGTGIQDAPAMESWLPPSGGTMVGTFVQETAGEDSERAIMFTEHLYLMEQEGTLVLKLKHFNADLTGWEEKDDMLIFRLVAIEDCAAYFNALTLRCAGEGRFVAAVRMKSDKPEPQELVFYFNRLGSGNSRPCPDAETTQEMNECYANHYAATQERHERYLEAARDHESERPELVAMIDQSEKAFEEYRSAECDAVYESWKTGTIRNMMALACLIDLTNHRTHTVWSTWLTFMDSTPPVLPEPKPAF